MKRIMICRPGNHFLGIPTDCFTRLVRYLYRHDDEYEWIDRRKYNNDSIAYARNLCLGGRSNRGRDQKPFQGRISYDWILWIDSDSVYIPNQVTRLFKHDLDIISGWYAFEARERTSVGKEWDISYFEKYGTLKHMTIPEVSRREKLINAPWTGLGFCAMKEGVMESLPYPWFRHATLDLGPNISEFAYEDASFCVDIQNKGFDIWVDPDIRVKHMKYKLY